MLSTLLAVALVMTPTCTAEVQPGVVVFALAAPVDVAMLDLSSGGRTWRERPSFDGTGYSVRWDARGLPPFAEIDYRWSGTLRDMTAVECAGTVTLADPAQDWMSARGDRVTVWWYDQPVEYGLRALSVVDAQIARLETLLPGDLDRARVVLYRTQADYGTDGLRSGMALNHDTIVAWPCGGGDYLFDVTLPHEVTHLWMRPVRRGMPEWFSEGLAVWSEPRDHAGERALAEAGPPLTWDEMQRREFVDVDAQQRWYAQAYALVDYIDREYDLAAIVSALIGSPQMTLEDALRTEVGLNSAQVMQGWRIDAGLEARQRKTIRVSLEIVRWLVIGAHVVALAGLTWWRVKLRQR